MGEEWNLARVNEASACLWSKENFIRTQWILRVFARMKIQHRYQDSDYLRGVRTGFYQGGAHKGLLRNRTDSGLFLFFLLLFYYLWLCWVFVAVRGLSLVVASGGHSSSRCAGLSLLRPLLLRSTGSRCAGSVVVAHGPSCSAACGIFPDQGWNPCPLHWQVDSQPLRHQGSPLFLDLDDEYRVST